jgi:predicted hydrolase (HD superfamily)
MEKKRSFPDFAVDSFVGFVFVCALVRGDAVS